MTAHDLRAFTHDRHRTVDDRPFGGGEGMVLKPEPLAEALEALGLRRKAGPSLRCPHRNKFLRGPKRAPFRMTKEFPRRTVRSLRMTVPI